MSKPFSKPFSITADLSSSGHRLAHAIEAVNTHHRIDFSGTPEGAAALFLARAVALHGEPTLVLTPDSVSAQKTAANLQFFTEPSPPSHLRLGHVLYYSAVEATPFVEVASDRYALMERLGVLFHLAQEFPFRFLVVPVAAALRRIPPVSAIRGRSMVIEVGKHLDRDELLQLLTEGGYLRAPLVEDPGSYAVRGSLIDVYPSYTGQPARIELDDEMVISIKWFNQDDQRTIDPIGSVWIHPVKDTLLGQEEIALARQRIGRLCDDMNIPSLRKRQLLDDIQQRRVFFGMESLLPAFHQQLQTIFDFIPQTTRIALFDPAGCTSFIKGELSRADRDYSAKLQEKQPLFSMDTYYIPVEEFSERLHHHKLTLFHELVVAGQAEPEESPKGPLGWLEEVSFDSTIRLPAHDQRLLISEISTNRSNKSKEEPLSPLVNQIHAWIDEGLRVLIAARTTTQAERLGTLLRSYHLPIKGKPKRFHPSILQLLPPGRPEIVIGELTSGFVLRLEALVCITESEIFGERRRQRERKPQKGKSNLFADLQQLTVGDYVVHIEHGVGKYLGLEQKVVPLSRLERLQGHKPLSIEVLVVEYVKGDKLFLPVTRLNQISKFAQADGARAKLDKLGGQTFSRTKSRVRSAVKVLADQLLALYAARAARSKEALPPIDRAYAEFEATFPFEETPDQARAIDDVLSDLEDSRPMDRLVCGDVGFGKTEVALRAAFRHAMNGRQVAMLCPTTVLAQQHYLTFKQRLCDCPIKVEVLSRFILKRRQTSIVAEIKNGTCDIVIGTHRLLSKDVHYKNLGLLIVDEEQRFGVAHKERIKQLKNEVDVLTLSATPIPRTLQMAVSGMRELSLIATPPVDRRAIRTFISRWDQHLIREAVLRELSRGGQVFLVHNRIKGLYERSSQLSQLVPEARIAVAHGQMKEALLERIMTDFVDGKYDILCSTAIVENGLDIPRANTILIDRADIYGLSQLYQLRGRVGRSSQRAYCYLIAPSPSVMTDQARIRIQALERFSQLGSGFQLASLDMELRGAGDLLGAEQSGNIAAVGLDLFVQMLEEAVAELRGEPIKAEIDPEITVDVEHYLPEAYISDVGIRLSLYQRFASAEDEAAINDLADEMENRFGSPPQPAVDFVRTMSLKPLLRRLKVLGCEATGRRVTLHFSHDAPLDAARVLQVVSESDKFQFTADLRLTRRYPYSDELDSIDRVRTLLRELRTMTVQMDN